MNWLERPVCSTLVVNAKPSIMSAKIGSPMITLVVLVRLDAPGIELNGNYSSVIHGTSVNVETNTRLLRCLIYKRQGVDCSD
jgi:hypothetical protein